jgi:hypothetical protein
VIPFWLVILSWISLALALLCAGAIAFDEARHPQKMAIMNLVWPLTALYASLVALWGYCGIGRMMSRERMPHHALHASGAEHEEKPAPPTWRQIAVSASHCGAGCMLADILGENWVFAQKWQLGGQPLYADYAVTFGLAWLFGVAFQYFSIKPMKNLSPPQALIASIRADTLSIVFYQIGMYSWMALVCFGLFAHPHLEPDSPVFWFMMQIGMALGFLTSCPVNGWLIRRGLKEKMG